MFKGTPRPHSTESEYRIKKDFNVIYKFVYLCIYYMRGQVNVGIFFSGLKNVWMNGLIDGWEKGWIKECIN